MAEFREDDPMLDEQGKSNDGKDNKDDGDTVTPF